MPMRPTSVRMSAAGFSSWIPLNQYSDNFGVGLGATVSNDATLTYTVQHTFDDLYATRTDFSIARVTTTATVTMANHGLVAGDWIQVLNAGVPLSGTFQVATVTNDGVFTYTVVDSGVTASADGATIQTARVFTHTDISGETTSQNGNYAFPPRACRLLVSAYTDGTVDLTVVPGGK